MSARSDIPPLEIDCADGEERATFSVDHVALGTGRARLTIVLELPGYGEGDNVTEGSDMTCHMDEHRARDLFIWLGKWLHAS